MEVTIGFEGVSLLGIPGKTVMKSDGEEWYKEPTLQCTDDVVQCTMSIWSFQKTKTLSNQVPEIDQIIISMGDPFREFKVAFKNTQTEKCKAMEAIKQTDP